MKIWSFLILITGMLSLMNDVSAQNRCAALRQEEEQLSRRLREVREELRNCGEVTPPEECAEKILFTDGIEVRSQCAQIRGNRLIVNFTVRNGKSDMPKMSPVFNTDCCKVFDQEGREYKAPRVTVGTNALESSSACKQFDIVYNIRYKCTLEFSIGNANITHISLLQVCIANTCAYGPLNFEDIEVK